MAKTTTGTKAKAARDDDDDDGGDRRQRGRGGRKRKRGTLRYGRLRSDFRELTRNNVFLWSSSLFALCLFLFLLALFNRFIFPQFPSIEPKDGGLQQLFQYLDTTNYDYCFFFATPLLFLYFGYVLFYGIYAHRKFARMVSTNSRQELTSNLHDLEDLAYWLGRAYEERLIDKKLELRVR